MLVISDYIPAGRTSRVHSHSGVEAFYTVDGDQCLETKEKAFPMKKGDTLLVPTGVTMRLVATGAITTSGLCRNCLRLFEAPVTRRPVETAS